MTLNFLRSIVGIFLSIIAGVAVGIIFSTGIIPAIINFIIVALAASGVSLLLLLGALIAANAIRCYNAFYKCVRNLARFVLAGTIGTLLAATIAITTGLAATSIVAIIFVALSVFFFVLMIVSIVCLFSCIINNTYRMERE